MLVHGTGPSRWLEVLALSVTTGVSRVHKHLVRTDTCTWSDSVRDVALRLLRTSDSLLAYLVCGLLWSL